MQEIPERGEKVEILLSIRGSAGARPGMPVNQWDRE